MSTPACETLKADFWYGRYTPRLDLKSTMICQKMFGTRTKGLGHRDQEGTRTKGLGQRPGQRPGQGPGRKPGQGPGQRPIQRQSQGPERKPGQRPGQSLIVYVRALGLLFESTPDCRNINDSETDLLFHCRASIKS